MRIFIIEDEPQAAKLLKSLLLKQKSELVILGSADSIRSSVNWLQSNPTPDLIFMDIQLGDGLSFEIFNQVEVKTPIIFTTAYDEYALKAFKVNSIDYLLKPIDPNELKHSLKKFESHHRSNYDKIKESMENVLGMLSKKHKTRFVIKVGEHLRSIEVSDILFFYSEEKVTFCQTREGRKHILDFTLDQLEGVVNPDFFFRISRKYIVHSGAIQDMISFTNSRLKIVLKTSDDKDVIVSRERVQDFKSWLDR